MVKKVEKVNKKLDDDSESWNKENIGSESTEPKVEEYNDYFLAGAPVDNSQYKDSPISSSRYS
jgi:hypothetical protein